MPVLRHHREILDVLIHIQQHLDDPLDLHALARVAGYSPFHFHRLFKALVGEGVAEHVRRLRLERAAHHLARGSDRLLDIAVEAGFESHEAFTRAFSSQFGQTPSAFRKTHRMLPRPEGIEEAMVPRTWNLLDPEPPRLTVTRCQLDPIPVAFLRRTGSYETAPFEAWERLEAFTEQADLLASLSQAYGLCLDAPEITPEPRIRYDACIPFPEGRVLPLDLGKQVISGGTYLSTRVVCAPGGHAAVWPDLILWAEAGHHRLRDAPALEIHHIKEGTPIARVVDLCLPLA